MSDMMSSEKSRIEGEVPQTEAELARFIVDRTGTNLFLTGRAGTGKTTFLKNLTDNSRKRMVVVAPTGIAAVNAGGVTIHSFFQLDFNRAPEEFSRKRFVRFSKEKLNVLRSMDVLVIDEISMVRADLLDRVDEVLRRHRNPRRPFGGVQLLMIGDLHQLPPVVTDSEAQSVMDRYSSPYFFESRALREAGFRTVELNKVYRQNDEHFITLLNAIRANRAGADILSALNARVGRSFAPGERFVRLVTHNRQARSINESELTKLPGEMFRFDAKVEGKFPESSYPVEESLLLKKGAQVMFIKNDLQDHAYYNGLLAEVTELSESAIVVRTTDGKAIKVREEEWVNNSYALDEEKGEILEVREGAFRQFPLRLAWAITIHKSQGLTFDRAVIDAAGAFAHGQTYVALSRCRTLGGLSLDRPLSPSAIITDRTVEAFMEAQTANPVLPSELHSLRESYNLSLLNDLFDFTDIELLLGDMSRTVSKLPQQYSELAGEYTKTESDFRRDVSEVARKFRNMLPGLLSASATCSNQDPKERVASGSKYFAGQLREVSGLISRTPDDVTNKELKKRLKSILDQLKTAVKVKRGLLEKFSDEEFTAETYIRLKSDLAVRSGKTKK